jgi:hypothetical protein
VAIERADGSGTMGHVGTEGTWWEWPVEANADEVAGISLRDLEGRVWCSAEFPA